MSSQETLATYDVVSESQDSSIRPEVNVSGLLDKLDGQVRTFSKGELPNISGFNWRACTTTYGCAEVLEYWQPSGPGYWESNNENPESIPSTGGLIETGLEDYLRSHALKRLSFPKYYSRFEEIEAKPRWSVDGRTRITWQVMKRCVRLVNGSGRINTEQTEVIMCAPGTLIVSGPRGVFLVEVPSGKLVSSYDESSWLSDPPDSVCHTIRGVNVPEEHPKLRKGLGRIIDIAEGSDFPVPVKYDGFNGEHTFTTSIGDTTSFGYTALETVAALTKTTSELTGTYEHYCSGETHSSTLTEDDLPGEVGDAVTLTQSDHWFSGSDKADGTIAGYGVEWKEKDYLAPSSTGVAKLALVAHVALVTPSLSVKRRTVPIEVIDP